MQLRIMNAELRIKNIFEFCGSTNYELPTTN
jgi:hypothetical protein